MKITKSQAIKLANKYKINLDVIDINEWHYGLNVELEHGSKFGIFTNITNNNLSITSKIVIAHLTEFPDYYKRLLKLETQADKYWSSRNKPNIFL
jgi:hypothetical protein